MTVFKAFLKILNKNKLLIIIYTSLLIGFAASNMTLNDTTTNYESTKPTIYIINKDNGVMSDNLVKYLSNNCKISNIKEELIDDALFNRQIYYIVNIPSNYTNDFLDGKNPSIDVKKIEHYNSSLAEMILTRYIKTANAYQKEIKDTNKLIDKINDSLTIDTEVKIKSKLKTTSLEKASFYYTFLSYSIIASLVYVICIILSSFRSEAISKRNIISSMNYKKLNMQLLLSNFVLSFVLWIFYVALSIILVGSVMFTTRGLIFILNSFIFTVCATALAFLIGNILKSKGAIGGIVNVIALGSSFLCGVFVPIEWLPNSVVTIGHLIPTYWYVRTNNYLTTVEVLNKSNINNIIFNMLIIIGFTILFTILSNIIYNKKRKIN